MNNETTAMANGASSLPNNEACGTRRPRRRRLLRLSSRGSALFLVCMTCYAATSHTQSEDAGNAASFLRRRSLTSRRSSGSNSYGSSSTKRDSPARGEQRNYNQYVGYRDRTSKTEASAYYKYPEEEEQRQSWWTLKYSQTTLADVWMCWGLAVAWATWMFGSFVKSDLLRYGQDSIMVRGNVRMVTREEASLGTGIPIYKAVIDYIIPAQLCAGRYGNPGPYGPATASQYPHVATSSLKAPSTDVSEAESASAAPALLFRKEFETLHPLEQGFGNVELLVLHHEPTTSIIKEDWEQQVMEEMEESRHRRSSPNCLDCCGCLSYCCRCLDGVFCGFLAKDSYGEHLIWKRIWICFCLTMTLVAMAGSVLAVHRLPTQDLQLGWISLCLESLLIIPMALLVRLALVGLQRSVIPSGRAGIVVSPSYSSTPTMKNHGPQAGQGGASHGWGDQGDGGGMCMMMDPADVLDVQVCEEDEVLSLQQTRQQHLQQQEAAASHAYMVRLPGAVRRESSNVSDMSNASQSVHLNTMDSMDSRASTNDTKSVTEHGVLT